MNTGNHSKNRREYWQTLSLASHTRAEVGGVMGGGKNTYGDYYSRAPVECFPGMIRGGQMRPPGRLRPLPQIWRPFTDQFRIYMRTHARAVQSIYTIYKAAHLHAQAAKEM